MSFEIGTDFDCLRSAELMAKVQKIFVSPVHKKRRIITELKHFNSVRIMPPRVAKIAKVSHIQPSTISMCKEWLSACDWNLAHSCKTGYTNQFSKSEQITGCILDSDIEWICWWYMLHLSTHLQNQNIHKLIGFLLPIEEGSSSALACIHLML